MALGPAWAGAALAVGAANDDTHPATGLLLEDQPYTVLAPGVLANDVAAAGEDKCVVNPPSFSGEGGTVSMGADGSFTYTSLANFFGADTIAYSMADMPAGNACPAVGESSAVANLTVTPVNDAPTISTSSDCSGTVTVGEDSGTYAGESMCVSFDAPGPTNESDQDRAEWLVQVSDPQLFSVGPSLTDDDDGSLQFTPAPNAHGTATLTIRAQDDGGTANGGMDLSAPLQVTISITSVNDPPTATADSFIVLADRTLNVGVPGVLLNDDDIEGDSITAARVTSPAHGVLTLAADGSFSYTPATGYRGPDAFSYRASDGSAFSPTRVVTLNVTAVPPVATPTPIPTIPPPSAAASPLPTLAEPTLPVDASPSLGPITTPAATSAAPSAVASLTPGSTPGSTPPPGPAGDEGGLSLPALLLIVLFVLLVGFGAALYVPKWIKAQRGEPLDPE